MSSLPTPDEIVTRRVAQVTETIGEAVLDGEVADRDPHAQTRWLVMFGIALAAVIIAAVGGIVAALV